LHSGAFGFYIRFVIDLTENAARQIAFLVGERRDRGETTAAGLRLSVEKGGCAGMQYTMVLGDAASGDTRIERSGAQVFVDEASAEFLSGCTLDYVDELSGGGFRIRNPHAVRSCGCGTSFETAESAR